MNEFEELLKEAIKIDPDNPMTYEQAVEYFKGKLPLTPKKFYELQNQYRAQAFTVSGYASLKIIQTFHDELTKAIDAGTSMEEFKTNMDDFLVRNGYDKMSQLQAENIFRTNIQTAYNVGAYEEMSSPEVIKLRPYWRYEAVDDSHTRPSHLAMNGRVFLADSAIWDTWYPPNGFRCRCSVSSLSKRQVEKQGLQVEEKVPDRAVTANGYTNILPDKDFCHNAAKVRFKPDLEDVPEALKKAYERREQNSPAKSP